MLHHKLIWQVVLALITSFILASVALPLPRDDISIADRRLRLGVGQADAEEPLSLDGWEAVDKAEWTSPVLCASGRCRSGSHIRRHSFNRPSNAQLAHISVWWLPSGNDGSQQDNEAFSSSMGITCPDFGDRVEEPQSCGTHNQRIDDGDLAITLTHIGYTDGEFGRTAGSIKARVEVTWYAPEPATCETVSQTLDPDTMQVSGQGQGAGVAWRIVDTAQRTPHVNDGTGQQAEFSFTAQYQRTYQLQFQDVVGQWSTDGCTFSFEPPPLPEPDPAVCHTVSVNIDQHTQVIRGQGSGSGTAWKVVALLRSSRRDAIIGETMVQGHGSSAIFTFKGAYDTEYQLFFQNDAGQWDNTGCPFSFDAPPTPDPAVCHTVSADITHQTQIIRGNGTGQGIQWKVAPVDLTGSALSTLSEGRGNQADFTFKGTYDTTYQLFFQNEAGQWSFTGCPFSFDAPKAATCLSVDADLDEGSMHVSGQGKGVGLSWRVVTKADDGWQIVTEPAINMSRKLIGGTPRKLTPEFSFESGDYDQHYQLRFLGEGGQWSDTGCNFTFSETPPPDPQRNEYQTIMGPVAFGNHTPTLELGKESFDGARSIMVNIEYLEDGQGDLVYRFNGQEMSGITASLFNAGGFRQVEITDNRVKVALEPGVTKVIAYQHHQEEARIFQSGSDHWIHPLDQPFEFKSDFALQLHGPPGKTETLVYGFGVDGFHFAEVTYDDHGQAVTQLSYVEPGLVGVYDPNFPWTTVEQFAATDTQMRYEFAETGLHFYQIVDTDGHTVADGGQSLTFAAQPGETYFPQLVYPETSLFVGLYDAMGFVPPEGWLMPVDGDQTHVFEFHADYHRLPDPDPLNPHIQGDVVIEQLYLLNATASVAQEFPYARRDNVLPGVTLVGIPDVSMVAFCQRPGWHEVVYWGGWENESYFAPDRSWIVSEDNARQWSSEEQGDCIDAAHRINMLLAREGLRTDHTWRHHGKVSQGYQMCSQRAWSPYNLVGLKPPHIGQLLTPGTVLPYYVDEADLIFWGWDLDTGGLADGVDQAQLSGYLASLGPTQYVDHTGRHPNGGFHE